jgi:HAD superfamily hydrolase (TIGR01509 family)
VTRAESLTRPPAGVLFDAGGTLVQVHPGRLAAALRKRGADPSDLPDAFWRTLVLMEDEFGPQSATGDIREWWKRWLGRFAEHCGVPAGVMAEAWREADSEQHLWDDPLPGAQECLTRLREAGLKVGVVSNADGRIATALARAGLAPLLDVIVDSTVVGVHKPDPAIFEHALSPLGLEPAETWYLGDLVAYDAAAAEAAGLQSWVIDHQGIHVVEHPRRVRSLAEFADAVLAA